MKLWWLLVVGLTLVVDPTSGVAVGSAFVTIVVLGELGVGEKVQASLWAGVAGLWTGCLLVFVGWMGMYRARRRRSTVLPNRAKRIRQAGFRVVDVHHQAAPSADRERSAGRRSPVVEDTRCNSNRSKPGCSGRYFAISLHSSEGRRPGPRAVRFIIPPDHIRDSTDRRPQFAGKHRRFPRSAR
jgi:hypothetical protein